MLNVRVMSYAAGVYKKQVLRARLLLRPISVRAYSTNAAFKAPCWPTINQLRRKYEFSEITKSIRQTTSLKCQATISIFAATAGEACQETGAATIPESLHCQSQWTISGRDVIIVMKVVQLLGICDGAQNI